MCSVNSVGETARPASSSATLSPASDSRLAAQPPVAPEPTITASYVCFRGSLAMSGLLLLLGFASEVGSVREGAIPAQLAIADLRAVVTFDDQRFHTGEVFIAGVDLWAVGFRSALHQISHGDKQLDLFL